MSWYTLNQAQVEQQSIKVFPTVLTNKLLYICMYINTNYIYIQAISIFVIYVFWASSILNKNSDNSISLKYVLENEYKIED